MKIPHTPTARPSTAAAGNTTRATVPSVSSTPAGSQDVRVSPLAAQVQSLSADLARPAVSDIDAARVAEIRQAIADGKIRIDPARIADGLIASLRELAAGDGSLPHPDTP